MTATQRDLGCPGSLEVHCELTQPALHPPRESDGYPAQAAPEVLSIELLVKAGEPVQQEHIAGPGSLSSFRARARRRVLMDGKCEEFPLG
jgi:hypothetical protein